MENNHKEVDIARLFFELGKTLRRTISKSFSCIGLTMPQGMLMTTLAKFGEMKTTELSKKINLSNSTISGIIDRLEKQQYIIRTRSELDRRIVYVKVSPKFEEINKEIHNKAKSSLEELLSTGTPQELEKIYDGLSALKNIIDNSTTKP